MSEILEVPMSQALNGDRDTGKVVIEKSWGEGLDSQTGAGGAGVPEIKRDVKTIQDSVAHTRRLREEAQGPVKLSIVGANGKTAIPGVPLMYHFFVIKDKSFELVGSTEVSAELLAAFKKDVSGRVFRKAVEKQFPGRNDYADIVSYDDNTTLKEIVDILGVI